VGAPRVKSAPTKHFWLFRRPAIALPPGWPNQEETVFMSTHAAHGLISAHGGGKLTARYNPDQAQALTSEAAGLKRLTLTAKQSCDLELLGNGGYSPLDGFMGSDDFKSVCKNMTLANGTVWSIPILLSVARPRCPRWASAWRSMPRTACCRAS
jgi:hypothetical protein